MAPTDGTNGQPPGLRVLIVDDSRDTADSLATLVALWGHRARAAYDAEAALRAATDDVPDVILVDLALPGRDGFALAADLRARAATRAARLFAVTGYSVLRDQALAGPFDDFLLKPFEPAALRQLLDGVGTGPHAGGCHPDGPARSGT